MFLWSEYMELTVTKMPSHPPVASTQMGLTVLKTSSLTVLCVKMQFIFHFTLKPWCSWRSWKCALWPGEWCDDKLEGWNIMIGKMFRSLGYLSIDSLHFIIFIFVSVKNRRCWCSPGAPPAGSNSGNDFLQWLPNLLNPCTTEALGDQSRTSALTQLKTSTVNTHWMGYRWYPEWKITTFSASVILSSSTVFSFYFWVLVLLFGECCHHLLSCFPRGLCK